MKYTFVILFFISISFAVKLQGQIDSQDLASEELDDDAIDNMTETQYKNYLLAQQQKQAEKDGDNDDDEEAGDDDEIVQSISQQAFTSNNQSLQM